MTATRKGFSLDLFELILLLIVAVLVSSVLEQLIPKVSITLIQIGLGILIAVVFDNVINVTLNPELFLVLFIAPLLFYEAKISDKFGLWRNVRLILSLAVGLVIVIMLVIGYGMNYLVPTLPLAAALALGAALGPTDAVAVSSLSETAKLDRDVSARLSGESLLNDASGVIAFQFAISAAVSGSYDVGEFAVGLTVDFFGGIVAGLILGWISHRLFLVVDKNGYGSNVFYVLFDVAIPFVVYLTAELFGVSGILAVVAAGIYLGVVNVKRLSPSHAALNIVTDNVWKVISFALNGIVFVLLGLQIPAAMKFAWKSASVENEMLIFSILIVTLFLVVVRFLWLFVFDKILKDPTTEGRKKTLKEHTLSTLIATFGGPKGAITLSVILSTPFLTNSGTPFPQRNFIIFVASGVILLTLLLANFVLPLLTPPPEEEHDSEHLVQAKADIWRSVIERLNADRTSENSLAVNTVIGAYTNRLNDFLEKSIVETDDCEPLRLDVIRHQESYIIELIDKDEVDAVAAYDYLSLLTRRIGYIKDSKQGSWWLRFVRSHIFMVLRVGKRYIRRLKEKAFYPDGISNKSEVQIKAEEEAVRYLSKMLDDPDCPYPTEAVADLMRRYQKGLKSLQRKVLSVTNYTRTIDMIEDIERKAYRYEIEEIQKAVSEGKLERHDAAKMRECVSLMIIDLDMSMA